MALNPYKQLNNGSKYFQTLERFIVLLYNKTSGLENVDEARMELFCHENQPMEKIPPTKAVLLQHSKHATYQVGVWTTTKLTEQDRPNPEGWGWSWDSCLDNSTPC